jgi:hypothetical protein
MALKEAPDGIERLLPFESSIQDAQRIEDCQAGDPDGI